MDSQLSTLLSEQRRFPPPADFAAQAVATADLYQRARADRLKCWEEEAGSLRQSLDFAFENGVSVVSLIPTRSGNGAQD